MRDSCRIIFSKRVWLLLGIYLVASMPLQAEKKLSVTYLSPAPLEHPFWAEIMRFMQAVAEDLDIDLSVVAGDGDQPYLIRNKGLNIIKSDRPDYLLLTHTPNVTPAILKAGNENNVNVFVFNTAITKNDEKRIGAPRERYYNWVGHMYSDGTQAGFRLADILIEQAITNKPEARKFNIIALHGREPNDYDTEERKFGLKRRVRSSEKAEIIGNTACEWSQEIARQNTTTLLRTHPGTDIIWAGSDLMALGGAEAAEALGRKPGEDIMIGGIDWAPEALHAIKEGSMNVSLGGHFMEGGWALILIHDYHHNIDFAKELGTQILTSMHAITQDNVNQYLDKFGGGNWGQVDFKQFSKHLNPDLEEYDFSLEALLKK